MVESYFSFSKEYESVNTDPKATSTYYHLNHNHFLDNTL